MHEARPKSASGWNALRFRLLVTLARRLILLRDAIVITRTAAGHRRDGAAPITAVEIISGGRRLEARLTSPATAPPIASVLILHGIGEQLDYWAEAQQMLACRRVASPAVHYSGYGRSQGATTPANLRQDVIAAYAAMRQRLPDVHRHFVLGLSLGTGIAVDAAPALTPALAGIILCESFSSFREAAIAVCHILPLLRHLSRPLSILVPDIYRTAFSARRLGVPLLLVHSDSDELFPAAMSQAIVDSATADPDASVDLHVLHGFAHNDAYLRPYSGYWQPILAFIERLAKPSGDRMEGVPKR
jgi:alpha-beta hydrolase superfamily lysophospholipase